MNKKHEQATPLIEAWTWFDSKGNHRLERSAPPEWEEAHQVVALAAVRATQNNSAPLTDKQLANIAEEDEFLLYCDQDSFNEIARAIEAAHGIRA